MRRRDFLKAAGVTTILGASLPYALAPGEQLRFCLMGDRTGRAQPGVYERTMDRIIAENPAFIINVGDSIEGYQDFWADVQWNEMKSLWKAYGDTPHYFTPGNHDIWSPQSEDLFRRVTGVEPRHSFTQRQCHITVLDNSRSDLLDAREVEFLEADLKKHAGVPLKMVFLHKPFWIPFLMLGSGEFDLHKVCKQYGVQWVISGHLHHLWHLERDGIQYVSLGSSGGSIGRGAERGEGWEHGWFYHYGVMEVAGNSATLQIKELKAPFGEGRQFPIEWWRRNEPTEAFPQAKTA